MKNISLFMISTVLSFSIAQQVRATTEVIEREGMREEAKKSKIDIPLYPETKEIMEDILGLDKVYRKVEASRSSAPDSTVLSTIKEHSAQYIEDLKEGYTQVEKTESSIERQEIIESIHQKNNPFVSFYY